MTKVENFKATGWYIYLIRFENNALYCGITTEGIVALNNITGRGAKLLRGRSNLYLVWSERVGTAEAQPQS